jgi:hypothetical protein
MLLGNTDTYADAQHRCCWRRRLTAAWINNVANQDSLSRLFVQWNSARTPPGFLRHDKIPWLLPATRPVQTGPPRRVRTNHTAASILVQRPIRYCVVLLLCPGIAPNSDVWTLSQVSVVAICQVSIATTKFIMHETIGLPIHPTKSALERYEKDENLHPPQPLWLLSPVQCLPPAALSMLIFNNHAAFVSTLASGLGLCFECGNPSHIQARTFGLEGL